MNKPTCHDAKRMKLRERLAVETPTSFKITTTELAQLDSSIDREIAVSRATRERRRKLARAGLG